MNILYSYLVIINALGFILMLADKRKAKKNRWRIPEATLLGIGLMGGSLGCTLSMRIFRHKTKHLRFSVGLPVMLVFQLLLLFILLWK